MAKKPSYKLTKLLAKAKLRKKQIGELKERVARNNAKLKGKANGT
jgi:hypothetical protein